ncbi:hypothetical protein [Arsenicibacter rosenii]|uniref:Uncharacterized protein n=1 Tax=Arsenicibacter rosenii TaxID=1750698 RepID=A0A1S2VBG6_9BACT|nr:hypothetical protein [Arsenicibacter rosenii]OIN56097.1 hypothetical protein BLX24_26355 [Arsenicibacter rosenii]
MSTERELEGMSLMKKLMGKKKRKEALTADEKRLYDYNRQQSKEYAGVIGLPYSDRQNQE